MTAPPATAANISIRKYIYFLPHPLPPNTPVPYTPHLPASNPLNLPTTLFEPTSTLVLTAPSGTFVDLRFLQPISPSSACELDWGFAGHSSSALIPGRESEGVKHSTWTHFVDSRVPVGQPIPVDEGDMYTIDSTRTLEVGVAFHPHLKAVKGHEEMWEDEDVTSTSTSIDAEGRKKCVVLRCRLDAKGVRGVVVRLGRYVQGILVTGNEVTAERWEWSGEGGWKRTKRVGKGMVPCGVLVQEELMREGVKVRFGEFEWGVEGVWEW